MSYGVELSEQAENDLRAIYEYIAWVLAAPQAAAHQFDRLEEKILSLGELPERCHRYEKEPWHSRGLRRMPVDHYSVFYLVDEQSVYVLRVIYGRRDMETQLGELTEE